MAVVTRFPTSDTNDEGLFWTSPSNAYADDGTNATFVGAAAGTRHSNQWRDFGFDAAIPVGSAIDSVKVIYEVGDDANGLSPSMSSTPFVGGAPLDEVMNDGTHSYPTILTDDHTADISWTRADLLDGTFAVRIMCKNAGLSADFFLDYVKVEVAYSSTIPIPSVYRPFNSGPM